MSELEQALARERAWNNFRNTLDGGSYCENASPDYASAVKIKMAYTALVNALLEHERHGFKFPTPPPTPAVRHGDEA